MELFFMYQYRISTRDQPIHKFGQPYRYRVGKNGIGTSPAVIISEGICSRFKWSATVHFQKLMGTGESDFHVTAVHFLAVHNAISKSLFWKFLKCTPTIVRSPDNQICGFSGKLNPVIFVMMLQNSCQNV